MSGDGLGKIEEISFDGPVGVGAERKISKRVEKRGWLSKGEEVLDGSGGLNPVERKTIVKLTVEGN